MPFDYEAKANARHKQQTALRIGIVGFGTFGQFLAKRLISQGHKVHLPAPTHRSFALSGLLRKQYPEKAHSTVMLFCAESFDMPLAYSLCNMAHVTNCIQIYPNSSKVISPA